MTPDTDTARRDTTRREDGQHDGGAPSAGTAPTLFRVVRGNPDAEEVAALAAVLAALSGGGTAAGDEAAEAHGSRRDVLRSQARRRRQLSGHPGAWRSGRF